MNVYGQTESGLLCMGVSTSLLGSLLPGVRIKVRKMDISIFAHNEVAITL